MKNENLLCFDNGQFNLHGPIEMYFDKILNADTSRRDYVELSESELEIFAEMPTQGDVAMSELLRKPSLKELELFTVSDSIPGAETRVVYKDTIFPKKSTVQVSNPDEKTAMSTKPVLDVYIYLCGSTEPDLIGTYYIMDYTKDGCAFWGGSSNEVIYISPRFKSSLNNDIDVDGSFPALMLRDFRFIYAGIQYALRNRPEVFVKRREIVNNSIPHMNPAPAYRRVYARKKYVICEEELAKYKKHTGRSMQCPSWGVIGHWRNYKSGKSVWIAPYRKGRERNNLEAYSPKNYQI